ncbi:hypothetical protein AS159_02735 [Thermotoga sp. Ku-13t]|uniref:imidazole glycerol phosphate synthase subunit HisH n=1 Tax=Thermotoga sp. Ku-13t TaxID=1755813 RepID=UPI0013EA30D1|nr:imidazole glycerol phosphate synthase subunit HisH [Thermotoga sp. Ku-13t]KAF2958619.1 hypothetical protein AS159_02735 [Thermotoga sp. Ku-13t]
MNIAIVSCVPGNVMNLYRAIVRLDENLCVELLERPQKKFFSAIFLPGVGHFEEAMKSLKESQMDEFILRHWRAGSLIVGVCLGMQLLFEESEESTTNRTVRGLGLLEGRVVRLRASMLPHVGWNVVKFSREIFSDLNGRYFYFVHSYRAVCEQQIVAGECEYEEVFPAVVMKDNVIGVQFHPEKSHTVGKVFLKKVIECAFYQR